MHSEYCTVLPTISPVLDFALVDDILFTHNKSPQMIYYENIN